MSILDSGERRQFDTGAVRDISSGKGRCDLLPLKAVAELLHAGVLNLIDRYIEQGDTAYLYDAISDFATLEHGGWGSIFTAIIEVSKQYEDGCIKYGERNWEKGISVHCYIDSGVRHYLKFMRGDKDEPHDRAFVWNMLGAIWTHDNKPELRDLPFKEVADANKRAD